MSIGSRLKEARQMAGMTQEELAKAVGVTKGAIGNYESEVSSPKEVILIKLMEILHIDANFVYHDFIEAKGFSDEEIQLVNYYRNASQEIRIAAFKMLEDSTASYKKD